MAETNMESIKSDISNYAKNPAGKSAERKPLKPVVSKDKVVTEKAPLVERIIGKIASQDTAEAVGYLFDSIVVPGIKNLALDALESFWFGNFNRARDAFRRGRGDYYDYGSAYYGSRGYAGRDRGRGRDPRDSYPDDYSRGRDDRRETKSYRNIVLRYHDDAEEVVNRMRAQISAYGEVTVFELFSLVDIQGAYTDHNWGWRDPRDIGIRRVSNGYLIDVPEPLYLD